MKTLFSIGHAVLASLFAALAVLLTVVAVRTTWEIVAGGLGQGATVPLIEAVGNLAVAVVALQIGRGPQGRLTAGVSRTDWRRSPGRSIATQPIGRFDAQSDRSSVRTKTRSRTPWPSPSPRRSNLVSGRYAGRRA